VIAWREARAVMRGLGGYVALTLALVAATWVLLIDVRALEAAGLVVLADPFRAPLAIAMLVLAVYLAISAAVSTTRDRESGTLEVLFYPRSMRSPASWGRSAGFSSSTSLPCRSSLPRSRCSP
jgi:hypothetical protein